MNKTLVMMGLAFTLFFSPQERAEIDRPKELLKPSAAKPRSAVAAAPVRGSGYLVRDGVSSGAGDSALEQWGRDTDINIQRVAP